MKNEEFLLSIIVPVYKVEPYIERCINSILCQSFHEFEVILVDDGSPDGCPALCDRYAKQDSRVKVIHQENGGVTNARKKGVSIACGKYITFVDGDDWVEKEMYGKAFECLNKSNVDILMMGYKEDWKHGRSIRNAMRDGIYQGKQKEKVLETYAIIPNVWTKIFKREIIDANLKEIDERVIIGEDILCSYSCILDADRIQVYNCCNYHYVKNGESATNTYNERYISNVKYLAEGLKFIYRRKRAYYLKDIFNWYIVNELLKVLRNEFSLFPCLYITPEEVEKIKEKLSGILLKKILISPKCSIQRFSQREKIMLVAYQKEYFLILNLVIKIGEYLDGTY